VRFDYEFLRSLRIRDCHAEVTLTPEKDGTHIRWHSTFRVKVPGTRRLLRHALQRFLADTRSARRALPSLPALRESGN
jgi:hypothetical protein